jgi:sRNA-binding carbon storage regulator CsrA
MALMTTIDIGDSVKIGDIEIKYVKKLGRKVGIAITAKEEIKITRAAKIVRKKDDSTIDSDR